MCRINTNESTMICTTRERSKVGKSANNGSGGLAMKRCQQFQCTKMIRMSIELSIVRSLEALAVAAELRVSVKATVTVLTEASTVDGDGVFVGLAIVTCCQVALMLGIEERWIVTKESI